jgi:undecaprenyl-phosphate galactose phosphotransferase
MMIVRYVSGTMPAYPVPAPSPAEGHYDWAKLHAAAIDRRPTDLGRVRLPEPSTRFSKRLFDIVATLALLAILSPVLLTLAWLARRDGGPALFGHRRVGTRGVPFKCLKFRTMVPNAQEILAKVLAADPVARAEWERDFKLKNDPRVTKVGKFLRVTSLDELPQLFNVLAGDMSLVGPRPIVVDEIRRYGAAFHDYARCRPGITGLWQVSGRNDVDYGQRVRLDRTYARTWSFLGDLVLLLRTPLAVLRRSGAY